jgi:Carbohydrate esterase, sialic acid-specific acetylesterase/Secretion system C-terminal sorting domain
MFVKRFLDTKVVLLLIICFAFSIGKGTSQIVLTNSPQSGAFLAQDIKYKRATTTLEGTVVNDSFHTLTISVYQSNSLIYKRRRSLTFKNGMSKFSQKILLPTGKYKYQIRYELFGPRTLTIYINDLMVGDVYLIQGQSNSVAADYGNNANTKFDVSYNDSFIRSFGTSSTNGSAVQADLNWYDIDASGIYNKGCVGQWGAVMAKCLLDSFGTPICLINGGVGGTRITQHTPDLNDPENLSTIYGRLLYRVRKAGLEKNIRGILYFQGESDGGNAVLHDTLFTKVNAQWNKDFPNFGKLYVIQVRSGCGGPSIQLRDVQRKFEYSLDKCQTVSANGLNNHDGCHYGFVNGYELLGIQMARLLGRDFYGGEDKNIDPPNVESCFYSNGSQTEITLNMQRPTDSIFVDTLFQRLFRIEGDNSVSITNGFIRNNQIVLQLNKSSCNITGLTYDGWPRTQPWVKSSTQMGLVSFYNVPILNHQIEALYEGCRNEVIEIGEDSIDGCSYVWKRIATGAKITSAKVKMKVKNEEEFSLIISYANTCRPNDTLWVIARSDSALFPELGEDRTICQGDTVHLKPSTKGFSSFTWFLNETPTYLWQHHSAMEEKISLKAISDMGCEYRDTISIGVSNPKVELPTSITLCPEDDTLISTPNTFKSYVWNGVNGSNKYLAKSGTIVLKVRDSFDCFASDTTVIGAFVSPEKLNIELDICAGQSAEIYKPSHIVEWTNLDQSLPDTLRITAPTSLEITIRDTNHCRTGDTIIANLLSLPEFNLGTDTGFCTSDSWEYQFPNGSYNYYWEGIEQESDSVSIDKPGKYTAKMVDTNNCFYEDAIDLIEYPIPTLSGFYDTTLCVDSSWIVEVDLATHYTINGQPINEKVTFEDAGKYVIVARSEDGCENLKTIEVEIIDCGLSVNNVYDNHSLELFPNPFTSVLTINSDFDQTIDGEIYDSRGHLIQGVIIYNGQNKVDLSDIPNGVYFLRSGHKSLPILKLTK